MAKLYVKKVGGDFQTYEAKPKVKKFAVDLATAVLSPREQKDVAVWLEDLAKKFRKGQITNEEPFQAELKYY